MSPGFHVFTLTFSFMHNELKCMHNAVKSKSSIGGRKEGEKPLNQQYFPQMENAGDILSPRSIWLGECFIWTGHLSGKAWCYDLLKVQHEGNCSVVGDGTYACASACNCVLMNIFIIWYVTVSLRRNFKDCSLSSFFFVISMTDTDAENA